MHTIFCASYDDLFIFIVGFWYFFYFADILLLSLLGGIMFVWNIFFHFMFIFMIVFSFILCLVCKSLHILCTLWNWVTCVFMLVWYFLVLKYFSCVWNSKWCSMILLVPIYVCYLLLLFTFLYFSMGEKVARYYHRTYVH